MTTLVWKALSILLCLALSTASFSAPFEHCHQSESHHCRAHVVHSHLSLHRHTRSDSRGLQVEDSDPPAHYLDTFWLEASAPPALPVPIAEDIGSQPPSPAFELASNFEFSIWRGPPPGDHHGLRSPPPTIELCRRAPACGV